MKTGTSTGMDNRLVLTILFVMLSWISPGNTTTSTSMTTAENTMTSASMTTTAENTMTSAPMTPTAGNTMTSAPMTPTAGNTMTSAPMTPTAGNTMTSAPMTPTAGNTMTSAPMTPTAGNTMTSAPMTPTAGNTMTSAPMTPTAGNTMTSAPMTPTTTAAPTTVLTPAPPLIPVANLETPISNAGCGSEKLCAREPVNCNPSGSESCAFLSARQRSNDNFEFELSGESSGYMAATLSTDSTLGGNDPTYLCVNNNGILMLSGAVLNNGQLMRRDLNVSSVSGRINGSEIQCRFQTPIPVPSTRTSAFAIAISNGTFDPATDTLGILNVIFRSDVVDLGNPNTVVNNVLSNTTTTPIVMTTANAITLQQSLTQVLLITVGLLGMAIL